MDLGIAFWIILIVFAIAMAFVLIKSILKAIMFSIIFMLIIFGLFAFFITKDISDLKANFMAEDKLVILKEDKNYLTAFSFKNLTKFSQINIQKLEYEEINKIKTAISSKEYSELTEGYYKILLIEYKTFNESLENGLSFEYLNKEIILSKTDVDELIRANNPVTLFFDKIYENTFKINATSSGKKNIQIEEFMSNLGIEREEEFKNYLFLEMIMDSLKDSGATAVISKIKNKEIHIYPNTELFKSIKIMPSFFLSKLTGKIDEIVTD